MKIRRRTAFTTPFVVVVGCSQPADRVPPRVPEVAQANPAPPPADAAIPDAANDPAEQPRSPDSKRYVGALRSRITRVDVVGGHHVVVIDAGSADGIDATWKAHFIDDAGRSSPAPCTIIKVDEHDLQCRYDATDGGPAKEALLEP